MTMRGLGWALAPWMLSPWLLVSVAGGMATRCQAAGGVQPSGVAAAPEREPVKDLASTLDPIREKYKLPALAAAVVTVDGIDSVGGVGVRSSAREEKVEVGDRFHLGSCTKAMTSTLIAILVEEGALKWEQTLAESFPQWEDSMHEKYRGVTIADLLTQRSGVPADLSRDGVMLELWAGEGAITDQRAKCVKTVLGWGPSHDRSRFVYSNTNFIIAGHIAEHATGKSWEELMQVKLFDPLGMASAGFGAPGTDGAFDQPMGHRTGGVPVGPGKDADNPPGLGPAGTVHASMEDWGKFITLHLRGARAAREGGEVIVGSTAIGAQTWKTLHTPVRGNGSDYAMGWLVADRPWARGQEGRSTVLTHAGSNTLWFCVVWAAPDAGFAVLSATNCMNEGSRKACDEASEECIKAYLENRPGK